MRAASALHATRPGLAAAQVGLAFDSFSFSNHILSVTSAWRSGMAPGSFAHPSSPAAWWGAPELSASGRIGHFILKISNQPDPTLVFAHPDLVVNF